MDVFDILTDSFGRVADDLPHLLGGLNEQQLLWQPSPQANHIAWLAWHIARCEDAQLAAIAGVPDVYSQGWADQFDLPYSADDIGYGQDAEKMRAFRLTDPSLLVDYYAATHAATLQILAGLDEARLDDLVDDPYQVSIGVRLVSVVNDITQHLGQIAYLRGLLLGSGH